MAAEVRKLENEGFTDSRNELRHKLRCLHSEVRHFEFTVTDEGSFFICGRSKVEVKKQKAVTIHMTGS